KTTHSGEPASSARAAEIRQELKAKDPSAIVGVVIAVLPENEGRFAAVGDVPVDEFRIGDAITFIDSNMARVNHGIVRRIADGALHVEYEKPMKTERAPQLGDLAVRFKS